MEGIIVIKTIKNKMNNMKQNNRRFIYGLITLLGCSVFFASCTSNQETQEEKPVLVGLEIVQLPVKTVYSIGESLDVTGMIVRKKYSDAASVEVGVTLAEVTGFDSANAQKSLPLTVTIEGFHVTFRVEITDLVLESLTLKKMPSKLVYTLGESLDLTGMEVVGRYSDGTDKPVAVDASQVGGFSSAEAIPDQVLIITVLGKTVSYTIQVLPLKVVEGVLTEVVGDVAEVVLPMSVKSIAKGVFENKSTTKVVLNEGLTAIGENVFLDSKVQEILFPSTLKEIGKYAFYRCVQLRQVDLSGTQVSVLNEGVFGFSGITDIKLPVTVKEIMAQAFMSTSGLKQLTLNEGLEAIRIEAFRASGVQTVRIPNSVRILGERVFYLCPDITEVVTYGSSTTAATIDGVAQLGTSCFEKCPKLTKLEIPAKIENIGRTILTGNTGVTSITIPALVKYIEFAAFKSSGIKNVVVEAVTPPVADVSPGAWYGFPDDVERIRVPAVSLDAYKQAVGWNDYASKIISE